MINEIFDINKFNIFSDDENYYFFRALNMGDNSDIENGITLDSNGEIYRIRTDRERYEETPIYNSDSSVSLVEMFDHIKMHHRTDTNCISLTSNANAVVLYGRGYYKDKYVMVKVPKTEFGTRVYNAGQYMISEIKKIIDEYLKNNELDDMTKYYLSAIDNATNEERLNEIMEMFNRKIEEQEMFEKGIVYKNTNTTSVDYQALNPKQNFEKNKMVAKINILKKNIIPNVANKFLIQTLGNAFSSLELINYNDIEKEYIIDIPKEIVDVLALLQQIPEDYPLIDELKKEVIKIIESKDYNVELFAYDSKKLNTDKEYTIENMYNLTDGNVDFNSSLNLYKKSFYLSKSKLRTISSVDLLSKIIDNDKYGNILSYLKKHTYGVEPEVFSRQSSNRMKVSESVNLDFKPNERELFEFIDDLSVNDLNFIINNPTEALKYYLKNFKNIEHRQVDKETYYANAIVDLFDWSKLDVVEFSSRQRNQIVEHLKNSNVVDIYNALKNREVKESDIANVLLTTIIKEKTLNDIDLKDTFTTEELENFLGYYKINGTKGLKLRSYQAIALNNIDKTFEDKQFTTAVLPTGAGKSFVALAEMLEHSDEDILYLAPNDEILNQIEKYILEIICDESLQKSDRKKIEEKFKNLKLCTYQSLLSDKRNEILNGLEQKIVHHKYGLIIFDELHRSGASEWKKSVMELLEHQDEKTKILGITATPIRDMDNKDMADEWAEYFGYTKEEIQKRKHLSINMDLEEAIRLGYVMNPKVVQCEYNLEKDGSLERLKEKIENIDDENLRTKELVKFEELRRRVLEADGIEKVIGDNIKQGGKYIIFCPVINKDGNIVETEDGFEQNYRSTGKDVIEKYQKEMILNIIKYRGTTNIDLKESDDFDKYMQVADELGIQFNSLLGTYSKSKNKYELEQFEKDDPDKIKFVTVINKLNEGVHVDGVDGIIWLRPLDENSKILFLQQFGRIIFSVDPNKKLIDEDRTIAIDIANNTFRVNINKTHKDETCDLDKLIIINGWIEQHNGKIPDLNSFDRIESNHGSTLKRIQSKYSKYKDDQNLLNELSEKEKSEVMEIINIGSNINLWTIMFPERMQKDKSKSLGSELDYDNFGISGILRDYYDLINEVDNIDNNNWNKMFQIAKQYYMQYGNLEISTTSGILINNGIIEIIKNSDVRYKESIHLGPWINLQRRAKNGTATSVMTPEREKLLDEIGMIWKIKVGTADERWMEMYEKAKMYYEQYENLNITQTCRVRVVGDKIMVVSKNDPLYSEAINLGAWIYNQKNAKKGIGTSNMTFERENLLNKIGIVWKVVDKTSDELWNEKYEMAKIYYEQYGNLDLKRDERIIIANNIIEVIKKDDSRYNRAIKLGSWIDCQRRAKKGDANFSATWNEEKEKKLTSIGMTWNIGFDVKWEENYNIAKMYYEQYGNLNVPIQYRVVINNGKIEIILESDSRYYDSVRLGEWVQRQRKNKRLGNDEISKLNQIGMIWNPINANWEENYSIAKMYYEQYGNLEVNSDCRVLISDNRLILVDKNTPEYENAIRLGRWIDSQRQSSKNNLDTEELRTHIEKLNQIGMIWNPKEKKWEENYNIAKMYYEQYGNLKISAENRVIISKNNVILVDKNAPEYENAIRLGQWLNSQRLSSKTNLDTEELRTHIEKLNQIGMIWDLQEYNFINKKVTSNNINKVKQKLTEKFEYILEQLNNNYQTIETKEDVKKINDEFSESLGRKK